MPKSDTALEVGILVIRPSKHLIDVSSVCDYQFSGFQTCENPSFRRICVLWVYAVMGGTKIGLAEEKDKDLFG